MSSEENDQTDLYFGKYRKKLYERINKFKPKLEVDLTANYEEEPTDQVEDKIGNTGIIDENVGIFERFRENLKLEDDFNDYQPVRKLGYDYYGVEVWKVKKYNRKIYARKQIPFDHHEMNARDVGNQITVFLNNANDGIVKYESFSYQPRTAFDNGIIYLILEYMNCGTIERIIRTVKTFNERAISQCMFQVLSSLEHFHKELGMIHRRIEPGKILVNDRGECKIKYTLSSMDKVFRNFRTEDMKYMSPERIQGESHSYNSDSWSLGLVACEMALGFFPLVSYYGRRSENVWEGFIGVENDLKKKSLLHFPKRKDESEEEVERRVGKFSEEFTDFIEKCMYGKKERWSSSQLIRHPFIKKYRSDPSPSFRSFVYRKFIHVMKEKKKGKGKGGREGGSYSKFRMEGKMEIVDDKERGEFVQECFLGSSNDGIISKKNIVLSNNNKIDVPNSFLFS